MLFYVIQCTTVDKFNKTPSNLKNTNMDYSLVVFIIMITSVMRNVGLNHTIIHRLLAQKC